jgi:hypothetical protein
MPSRREALVAMVQPADLRYGDDSPLRRARAFWYNCGSRLDVKRMVTID